MASTKQISNPVSTGGGGVHFESHVQSSFVTLMLTGGYAPCLPPWPIFEIKLQGKVSGFDTDDLIVYIKNKETKEVRKLLGQVKRTVNIRLKDEIFSSVIHSAWQDFNGKNFNQNKDVIALITRIIPARDVSTVIWLLDQAKHTKDSTEFYTNVNQSNFSPSGSVEKLQIFEHHLKLANSNLDLTPEQVWLFLRHFHYLGYDLGNEYGVVLSLLHSHMSSFTDIPKLIWCQVVDTVNAWNQSSGTITLDLLPDDLLSYFRNKGAAKEYSQPSNLIGYHSQPMPFDWVGSGFASIAACLCFVEAWDESNLGDQDFIARLVGEDYSQWIHKLRAILRYQESPVSYKKGIWRIKDPLKNINEFSSLIFTSHVDQFLSLTRECLNSRLHKSIDNSISSTLSFGIANGLAFLGSFGNTFENCSSDHITFALNSVVEEILSNIDSDSLSVSASLLPMLAESSPEPFIRHVESLLESKNSLLYQIVSTEHVDGTASKSIVAIISSLEILCWEERYLIRCSDLLARLSFLDNFLYGKSSSSVLSTIYLPWLPQTLASSSKRMASLRILAKSHPEISWKLFISLLPNRQTSSSGTNKPKYKNILLIQDGVKFSNLEYSAEVAEISETLVDMALGNAKRVCEIINLLGSFPKFSIDKLINYLLSSDVKNFLPDENKAIWEGITLLVSKHRRYSDAAWAIPEDCLIELQKVADKLIPADPFFSSQHYFNFQNFDLSSQLDDWDLNNQVIDKKRENAIKEVFEFGGLDLVLKFSDSVKFPGMVGLSFASVFQEKFDDDLLPHTFEVTSKNIRLFIRGYVLTRYRSSGLEWVDKLQFNDWTASQISAFLGDLPATKEIWDRAGVLLGEFESIYWESENFFPEVVDQNLNIAIDKLAKYKNFNFALDCLMRLYYAKESIDPSRCMMVLKGLLISDSKVGSLDNYHVTELIAHLQKNVTTKNINDVCEIEWGYLNLLDGYHGASPIFLHQKLAWDPMYFHSNLVTIYKSKYDISENVESTELEREIANKAWALLHGWKTPPGLENGIFSESKFNSWIETVLTEAEASGHLDVAILTIGQVLVYAPPDEDGLWINRVVADLLEKPNFEKGMNGFVNGLFNKRGVHWVDPTGQPELDLAQEYEIKADKVENAGFLKLAVALRNLSDSYKRDAAAIVDEYSEND